jgi:hypothetical protein
LFWPVYLELAVGKIQLGPKPSSQSPASFGLGETSWSSVTSPNAVVRLKLAGWPGSGSGNGVETKSGTTGRVIRFQSSLIPTGSTGWKSRFELQRLPTPGPGSTRKLFCWNVMDQISLTGLVSALLSSEVDFSWAKAGRASRTAITKPLRNVPA